MVEANELFSGWDENPPVYLMVKALVEGFGGKPRAEAKAEADAQIPAEAQAAMQNAVMADLAAKAGRRLPILRGPDKGLPKLAPVFDVEELRQRNQRIRVKDAE